jgi:predicted enzyme related to lactoylglutathione lyase
MIKRMAFVGQPARDMARAQKFYGEVLGLELDHDFGHGWAEYRLPGGTTLALDAFGPKMIGDKAQTYLSLELDDLEAYVERLQQAGVTFLMPFTINRNDEDREICRMAIIEDSEGSPVMLHQRAAWRD